jgi:hypothetical protein
MSNGLYQSNMSTNHTKTHDLLFMRRSCPVDVPYLIRYEANTRQIRDIYGTYTGHPDLSHSFSLSHLYCRQACTITRRIGEPGIRNEQDRISGGAGKGLFLISNRKYALSQCPEIKDKKG